MGRISKLHNLSTTEKKECIKDFLSLNVTEVEFKNRWGIHRKTMEREYGKANKRERVKSNLGNKGYLQRHRQDKKNNFALVTHKLNLSEDVTQNLLKRGITFTEILSAEKIGDNFFIIEDQYKTKK